MKHSQDFDVEEVHTYEGEAFVSAKYEPKDQVTKRYVGNLLDELGLNGAGVRETTRQKYIYCLSDILVAVMTSSTGLICWPRHNDALRDKAYGRDIAGRVFQALEDAGYIAEVQASRQGLSKVYHLEQSIAREGLRFREHGIGPVIEVREEKPKVYWAPYQPKGGVISLRHFRKDVWQPLERQVRAINAVMGTHPLKAPNGRQWASCRRIFNDGRLDRGGRLYGGWQSEKAKDRLSFTIDGQAVCEIDIKGSFLFLANALTGSKVQMGSDPYQRIRFVREGHPNLRNLAKRLVSSMLSNPNPLTRFPTGDTKDEYGGTVSLKDQYNLPKSAKVTDYTRQISKAFPFIDEVKGSSGYLMYVESNVIVETLLALSNKSEPIPAYPVHDCLICKVSDEEAVISALHDSMLSALGAVPVLDIEYSDGTPKIIEVDDHSKSVIINGCHQISNRIPEDDDPLFEDLKVTSKSL